MEYDQRLAGQLIDTLRQATAPGAQVRQLTLEMTVRLLRYVCFVSTALPPEEDGAGTGKPVVTCLLHTVHLRAIEDIYAGCLRDVALAYQRQLGLGDDARGTFLDLFEREFRSVTPSRIERLMQQEQVLLTPTRTQVPGLTAVLRLPHNESEILSRSIQTFFFMRKFLLDARGDKDKELPLQQPQTPLALRNHVQLSDFVDIIACNVISKNRQGQLVQVRRFMVVDPWRLVLIEPDNQKLGFGVVRFIADLSFVSVETDDTNTRTLVVSIVSPKGEITHEVFGGRFVFDDHIRCVAARQYVERGRYRLRAEKLRSLEELLGISQPETGSFKAP